MYDVLVVGAGPGGSSAAYYLAKGGLKVGLVDKAEFPREKTCGDGLTPRALQVLKDMGLYEEVAGFAFRINGLELHGPKGDILTAPVPKHSKYPNYLLIAPRLKLDAIIQGKAATSGAAYMGGVGVNGFEQFDDHVEVKASSKGKKQNLKSRVVILAVGANTSLLMKMGILNRQPPVTLGARGYFAGVEGLSDRVEAHFKEAPLPGYGWVFPISETAANVGIGYWKSWAPWRKSPSSARTALKHFLEKNSRMQAMLGKAKPNGRVKGFPIRTDFASAPTQQGRVLLVGESAGLVSPLTGEGIDFALESGQLAARFLLEKFDRGELSAASLGGYDGVLREKFQRLFVFLSRIRHLYLNPVLMNRAIRAAEKFPDIKHLLVRIMMGQADAAEMVRFEVIRKVVLGV